MFHILQEVDVELTVFIQDLLTLKYVGLIIWSLFLIEHLHLSGI